MNGRRDGGRDTVGWCYHTRIIVVGSTTMIFLITLMWKIHSIIDGLMAAPLLTLMGCIVCIDIITIFTPNRCFPSAVRVTYSITLMLKQLTNCTHNRSRNLRFSVQSTVTVTGWIFIGRKLISSYYYITVYCNLFKYSVEPLKLLHS